MGGDPDAQGSPGRVDGLPRELLAMGQPVHVREHQTFLLYSQRLQVGPEVQRDREPWRIVRFAVSVLEGHQVRAEPLPPDYPGFLFPEGPIEHGSNGNADVDGAELVYLSEEVGDELLCQSWLGLLLGR